jgi:hypothetical protein
MSKGEMKYGNKQTRRLTEAKGDWQKKKKMMRKKRQLSKGEMTYKQGADM